MREGCRAAHGRADLMIELKVERRERELAERVVRIIHDADFAPHCLVVSLNLAVLHHVRTLDPGLRICLITAQSGGNPTALPVDGLSVATRLARDRLLRQAHRRGLEVYVWTVNDRRSIHRMLDQRVDGIITDDPALLREVLAERRAMTYAERILYALRHYLGV